MVRQAGLRAGFSPTSRVRSAVMEALVGRRKGEQVARPISLVQGFAEFLGRLTGPPVDRFALPRHWSFLGEANQQQIGCEKSVIALIGEVFAIARRYLGPDRARDIWRKAAEGKPGRPKGRRRSPGEHAMLLDLYDTLSEGRDERSRKSLPRVMATDLKRTSPDKFLATVGSIETRIRRLLTNREQDRAAKCKAERESVPALAATYSLLHSSATGGWLNQAARWYL